ncbi:MAG TPA: NUDIX domain-containing protein [Candidatus Limnocylindrales bacterium]|nr:NUDIX domain-containing protein [Candidatus Limnocylindrales bacterium]
MSGPIVDELVLVVPRTTLMGDPGWHGLDRRDLERRIAALATAAIFVSRGVAERDRTLKQVIPYVVVRDTGRVFLMRRTRAGADERLHDRYSIGVGGHVGPSDDGIEGGLRREWAEELEASFSPTFELVGLLNDDSTDVGAVHLGLVYVVEASGGEVVVRETDKLSGSFATLDEARAVRDRMESWSAIALDELAG